MKSDKVPVPSQVQERVLPEARCDDTAVPRVPDSAHTAPPARCPAQSAGTLHSMPWSQPSAAPRTLASGAASSAPGCGRRGDRRDRSGVCSSRRHLEATADLAAHCWASFSSRGLVKTCTGTELGRGRGLARAVPRSPLVALLRFPCTLPSPPPPRNSVSWARPLHPHPRLSHAVLCGGRAGSAESARRPPQAASNRSPDHVGSALQAGV